MTMESYIGVDNVCAWPNLTKMPDGAIVATIFNQPCHGNWEGDVECWASEDEGRIWSLRGTPAPHEPGTNRMNVAAGLAANGDLIVIASGWTHRPRKEDGGAGFDKGAQCLVPWVARSADGGRTWQLAETLLPADGSSKRIIPFGDIIQLQDGALGVCIYSYEPPNENNSYFYSSADDGQTWTIRGIIQEGNICETAPLLLSNGDLLACARTMDDHHLELFRSTDQGCSWQGEQALTAKQEHPAHLLNLADGRILLTYGIRSSGNAFRGIGYRLSADGGHTWSAPAVLHESRHHADVKWPASDGGYPASVELADGTIVTAFYSSCVPQFHDRYHMGVIRWTCAED